MADAKLSELTAATTAASSDQLYLVQSGTSKKITTGNLFGNVGVPTVFEDRVQINDSDTITSPGAVSIATNVSYISTPDSTGNLTIVTGYPGQIKIFVMTSNTGSNTLTLGGSTVEGSVVFASPGDTATMIYNSGTSKWYMIGGTASYT